MTESQTHSSEAVIIIGAGVSGLLSALELCQGSRKILLLERDPAPPSDDADDVFANWTRRGATQVRHSHAFLGRLRKILMSHPDLMQSLREAGCREIRFADMLPKALVGHYQHRPDDDDLTILTSRRTTFEMHLRRYVMAHSNIEIVSDAFVEALILDHTGALPSVRGVRGMVGQERRNWAGDVVVDASGRMTAVYDRLADQGIVFPETQESAGILYYTRHYQIRAGVTEPARGGGTGTGDVGYLKFGLFHADNGWFSITLAVPEIETAIRSTIVDPDMFDRICSLFPGIAEWTDPAVSEPRSKVFGMGDLVSRWRGISKSGRPLVENFFPIGDALIRTNPLYGRGCTFAAIEAQALKRALDSSPNPTARTLLFESQIERDLSPYYRAMLSQDRGAIRRASQVLDPDFAPDLRNRLLKGFIEDGVMISVRSDVDTLRAAMRAFHMLDPPTDWMRRPASIARALGCWAGGKRLNARHYDPPAGPERSRAFERLGLDPLKHGAVFA